MLVKQKLFVLQKLYFVYLNIIDYATWAIVKTNNICIRACLYKNYW